MTDAMTLDPMIAALCDAAPAPSAGDEFDRATCMITMLYQGRPDIALAWGWSPIAVLAWSKFTEAEQAAAEQAVTEASGRGVRHLAYSEGVVKPPRRESAAERDAKSRAKWFMPLDQLLAGRSA